MCAKLILPGTEIQGKVSLHVGGKSGHMENQQACGMCAAGLYSARPEPSPLVQDRQESNGMSLQKKSELLQPVSWVPFPAGLSAVCPTELTHSS